MKESDDADQVDPVGEWFRAHDISKPECRCEVRLCLPGGLLVVRTNDERFVDYAHERCGQMLAEGGTEMVPVTAEACFLDDTTLPAVRPVRLTEISADRVDRTAFDSYCTPQALCAWQPHSLMGCAAGASIRVLSTAPNYRHYQESPQCAPPCGAQGVDYPNALDLTLCLYARLRNLAILHGAVLEKNGQGVLIIGASGVGKTTAALALVRSGFRLLSDEYAVLWKGGDKRCLFSGLLVPAMIVGKAPASLLELDKTIGVASKQKEAFKVDAAQACFRSVNVGTVLVLTRPAVRKETHLSQPVEAGALLPLLMAQVLDPVRGGRMSLLAALAEVAMDVSAYRVVAGSDLTSIPAFVEDLMANSHPA